MSSMQSKRSPGQKDASRWGTKNTMPLSPGKPIGKAAPSLKGSLEAGDSYYENMDFGSIWLTEFLSYEKTRNETLAKTDLLNFTKLPGSAVHPHAEKHLVQQSKRSIKKSTSGGEASRMSDNERRRLDELSKTLLSRKRKTNVQAKKMQNLAPYVEANTKISRVLKHMKLKANKEDMQASQLEDFYKLVSRETAAAVVIQSQCRRVLATKFVQRFALETDRAIEIQSQVRRLLARLLLEQMQEERRRARLLREKFVRVFVTRCRRRKQIKLEHDAAIICQSAMRMLSAKIVLRLKVLQHTWEVNQKQWIALSVRLSWKDLRIYFYARKIQSIVRRRLSKKRVSLIRSEMNQAAVLIQSVWRRFVAQRQKSEMLYNLEVDQRSNKIRIILSEQHYWKEQIEELTRPPSLQLREDFERRKAELQSNQREVKEKIRALESHYKDQLDIQQKLTPRSIEGGWGEQVKINLKDTREMITKAKLEFMFNVRKELLEVQTQIDRLQSREDEAVSNVNHFSLWRQIEQDNLWDFQRQHDRKMEETWKRHRIVEEKMRWAVKFYNPNGKPDKRRPLVHNESFRDDTTGESDDHVRQLMEMIKTKADEVQAQEHLNHTFQPCQKMWDNFNELAIGGGFEALMQDGNPNNRNKQGATSHFSLNETGGFDNQHSESSAAARNDNNCLGNVSLVNAAFAKKPPFHLVDIVRNEKKELNDRFMKYQEE